MTALGVLCLSACDNSILMWSHYADEHKGFCIGFNNSLVASIEGIMQE